MPRPRKVVNETTKELMKNYKDEVILALDPSGNTTSGYLLLKGDDIEINSFTNEKWESHVKFFHEMIKQQGVNKLILESGGSYINKGRGFRNKAFFDLLSSVYGLITIGKIIEEIEVVEILNLVVHQLEKSALNNEIKLLAQKMVNVKTERFNKNGVNVKRWTFNEKIINEHEKDAVLIFYSYWVKKMKRQLPW